MKTFYNLEVSPHYAPNRELIALKFVFFMRTTKTDQTAYESGPQSVNQLSAIQIVVADIWSEVLLGTQC